MEQYLRKYQAQKPMVPFTYHDLKEIVKSFLDFIVKPNVIESCSTAKSWMAIKLDESNLMKGSDISMGFGVKECLKEMVRKDTVKKRQINAFKSEGYTVITTTLKELYERSPLSKDILRYCGMFEPGQTIQASKKLLTKYFKGLFDHLMECKIISSSDCDSTVVEFTKFLSADLRKLETEFQSFDQMEDRLEEFWFGKVHEISSHLAYSKAHLLSYFTSSQISSHLAYSKAHLLSISQVHKYPHTSRILKLIFCLFHKFTNILTPRVF